MTAANVLRLAAIAIILTPGLPGQQPAPPRAEDCAGCHDSGPRIGKRQPGVPPGFHAAALKASPHAALECVACHSAIKEVPHPEKVAPVDCGPCHSDEQSQYTGSVHGKKAAQNDPYAPNCKLCHGTHDILPPSNLKSPVATINVPRALRKLSQRRHRGQQDARDSADQYPRELQGQHSRHRPLPAGPDRYRGLHQLPHGAQHPSPHGSAVLDRQTEYRQDLHAVPRARSRTCTAR